MRDAGPEPEDLYSRAPHPALRRDVKIVLYHHIAGGGDPLINQLGVSISPETFRQHIRYLSKNFDLISASDLLTGKLPRKPLLITFDDAYRSVLDCGSGILREANAPAIFFVSLVTPLEHSIPLDNLLSLSIEELGLKSVLELLGLQARGITSAHGLINKAIPGFAVNGIGEVRYRLLTAIGRTESEIYTSSHMFLNLKDLGELGKYRVEVGNHSMHHVFFRGLTGPELKQEITESRMILEQVSGQSVNCFSIPYGNELDATPAALAVLRESGHRAVFLVHARSNRFRPAEDVYYRIDAGSRVARTLRRKLYVEPLLRTIRDMAWHSAASGSSTRAPAEMSGLPADTLRT